MTRFLSLSLLFLNTLFLNTLLAASPALASSNSASNSPRGSVVNPPAPSQAPQALRQGRHYYQAGEFDQAITHLQQAVQQFAQQPLYQASVLATLASAHIQMGELATAQAKLDLAQSQLRTVAPSTLRNRIQAQISSTQGLLHLEQRQYTPALAAFEREAAIYEHSLDGEKYVSELIRSQINQSQALRGSGHYNLALKKLEAVEENLAQVTNPGVAAAGLRNLGEIRAAIGNFGNSSHSDNPNHSSNPNNSRDPNNSTGSDNSSNPNNSSDSDNDFITVERLLNQSLTLAKQTGSSLEISQSQLSLGRIYHAQWRSSNERGSGEVQDLFLFARKHYRDAAKIAAAHPSVRVESLLNELQLYTDHPEFKSSPEDIKQIEATLTGLPDNRFRFDSQLKFAELRLERQPSKDAPEYEQIIMLLNGVVDQAQQRGDHYPEAYGRYLLSKAYKNAGELKQALAENDMAWELLPTYIPKPQETETTEEPQEPQESTYEQLDGFTPQPDELHYQLQWQRGQILKLQKNYSQASEAYTIAIGIIEELRVDLIALNPDVRFNFREEIEPVYREAADLYTKLAREAPHAKDRNQQLVEARNLINSLQKAELINFFRANCINTSDTLIDESLEAGQVLVYPLFFDDRLEILVSHPDQSLEQHSIDYEEAGQNLQEIEQNITRLRDALVSKSSAARSSVSRSGGNSNDVQPLAQLKVLPPAQALYDLLIRPLEPTLEANQIDTLVFVLSGSLRNVPMAALYDGKQYLIEKYAIALSPGLQLREPEVTEGREIQAIVGALSEARAGFVALPAVKKEVEKIKEQVQASRVLLDQDFQKAPLEDVVSTVPFPVVHLATHGKFSSKQEDTFILTWDGELKVNELSRLLQTREFATEVPIELLILSACETARGDKQAALGLAGVAIQAGARSTVASLWQVNDESTASLMVQLYGALEQRQGNKAKALQEAQLSLLNNPDYEHPYYWSAFVLVGNWL
jgi:CHAT domain-containing protein/tyrosine-protein phosphatase YwqE